MILQSGRAMDHVHHEQARHSSRGSLIRANAGKVKISNDEAAVENVFIISHMFNFVVEIK